MTLLFWHKKKEEKPILCFGEIEAVLETYIKCPTCSIPLRATYRVSHGMKSSNDIVITKTDFICMVCGSPFSLNDKGELIP